jgi:hypothetical protein
MSYSLDADVPNDDANSLISFSVKDATGQSSSTYNIYLGYPAVDPSITKIAIQETTLSAYVDSQFGVDINALLSFDGNVPIDANAVAWDFQLETVNDQPATPDQKNAFTKTPSLSYGEKCTLK